MILDSAPPKKREIKEENWPQTTQVFDLPKIDFQSHQWRQEGYYIIDTCASCPEQSIPIPYGKMLIRKEGKYTIVDEV